MEVGMPPELLELEVSELLAELLELELLEHSPR